MGVKKIISICAWGLLMLLIVAGCIKYAIEVKNTAQQIAGDNPFCVQTAGQHQYVIAYKLRDFFPLFMRGHGGYHHAVLVVDEPLSREFYHWSYFKNTFVREAYGPVLVYCAPTKHYFSLAGQQPMSQVIKFTWAGTSWAIPDKYRLVVDSPQPLSFHFYAPPPDFNVPKVDRKGADDFIEVVFARQSRLDVWKTSNNASYSVAPLDNNYGLNVQHVELRQTKKSGRYEFYTSDEEGKVTTIISCFESMTSSCLHSFTRDGRTYTFHHSPEYVATWQELQNKLVDRVKSFQVEARP